VRSSCVGVLGESQSVGKGQLHLVSTSGIYSVTRFDVKLFLFFFPSSGRTPYREAGARESPPILIPIPSSPCRTDEASV